MAAPTAWTPTTTAAAADPTAGEDRRRPAPAGLRHVADCRTGLLHRGVERDLRRREVRLADERERVGRAPVAVHAAVLPFDRERALVADPVQSAEELLEIDVAVAGGDEVPPTRLFAEVQVRPEDRAASVEPLLRVLDVHVVDPVGELERELRGVEVLVREVARVEVDPERLTVADRVQGLPRRDEVVRDLRRVHLEAELDAFYPFGSSSR